MDSAETKEAAVSEPGESPADASPQPRPDEARDATNPPSADVDKDDRENEQAQCSRLSTVSDVSSLTEAGNSTVASDDESDVCSSIADSENADSTTPVPAAAASKAAAKPRKRTRQPAIMIGYKKRRKTQYTAAKKHEDEMAEAEVDTGTANGVEAALQSAGEDKSESTGSSMEKSTCEENMVEASVTSTRSMRKYSSVSSEITVADKFCWICHKEGSTMLKCIACPRVYHSKCHFQGGLPEGLNYDPSTFHCPECSAVLKADNVDTRSPVLVTVNLEQLCTLLQHIICILKSQKDSHYFWGPVDTKEFPHYREYVVYPMDLSMLEKNIKNEVYGCTEAFLADIKWIVHNSIVFNSSAAKITNVAKNLLKICKREIQEVETCAECYYNSLVRKDTWFIEVCKRPHLLVWARLKGYPPWPAKALKCKDGMVDCRFFGAHDKAWVPLKDCYLYSKIAPQPVKLKKGSHLESGIQELEKHIKKLKDKFGIFVYPAARIPYRPSQELEQLRMMLPNFNPNSSSRPTKYLIHPDRVRNNLQSKALFNDDEEKPVDAEEEILVDNGEKPSEEADGEANLNEEVEETLDSPPHVDNAAEDSSFESSSEAETSVAPADVTPPHSSAIKTETPSSPPQTICEPPTSSRKLVSVKNIDSINASVANTPSGSPASSPSPEATSGGTPDEPKETASTAAAVSGDKLGGGFHTPAACPASKSPSAIVNPPAVVNPTIFNPPAVVTPSTFVSPPAVVTPTVVTPVVVTPSTFVSPPVVVTPAVVTPAVVTPAVVIPTEPKTQVTSDATSSEVDFDLNKVKDEPIESDEPIAKDVNLVILKSSESTTQPELLPPVIPPPSFVAKLKRPSNLVDEPKPTKRVKPDAKCRTVNITENVTLSLINQSPPDPKPRPPSTMVRPKKPVTLPVPSIIPVTAVVANSSSNTTSATRVVYGFSSPSDINLLRSKTTPALLPVSSVGLPANRPNTKIQPRIVNHMSQTNGSLTVSTKPAVTVTPSRASPKINESYGEFFNKAMNECLSECQSQFRRIFESTLEKLINKGDLRARIVALKKEIDVIKRNHELVIDEMRRDYEVQIAELRATSVAKSQFDLAAERVKLEQEKERAVKEAKSKQWCSNCQKIANYYCCWNTAYCDYECQKEHWIQHMHVCKNDVKKKAAESSENEPPRIMMQSEISNGYPMNGYERTGSSYSYGNVAAPIVPSHPMPRSGNFNRPRNKIPSQVRISRPLLPRVTCTVSSTSTSSSSPAMNGAIVKGTFQNSRPPAYSAGNNVSAIYSPMYQK